MDTIKVIDSNEFKLEYNGIELHEMLNITEFRYVRKGNEPAEVTISLEIMTGDLEIENGEFKIDEICFLPELKESIVGNIRDKLVKRIARKIIDKIKKGK
jgi:hypothetical protein